MITSKNLGEEPAVSLLQQIKQQNVEFEKKLRENIISSSFCLSEEKMTFILENVSLFEGDKDFIYYILVIFADEKCSCEFIRWLLEWLEPDLRNKESLGNYQVVITEAFNHDFSEDMIKGWFCETKSDVELFEKLSDAIENSDDIQETEEKVDYSYDEKNIEVDMPEEGCEETYNEYAEEENNDVISEAFKEVFNVVKCGEEDYASNFSERFNKIVAKIQTNLTELTSTGTEMARLVENKNGQNRQTQGIYVLLQRIIREQSNKINRLTREKEELERKLNEADKQRVRQEMIANKMVELQNLVKSDGFIEQYD